MRRVGLLTYNPYSKWVIFARCLTSQHQRDMNSSIDPIVKLQGSLPLRTMPSKMLITVSGSACTYDHLKIPQTR